MQKTAKNKYFPSNLSLSSSGEAFLRDVIRRMALMTAGGPDETFLNQSPNLSS